MHEAYKIWKNDFSFYSITCNVNKSNFILLL